MDLKSKIRLRPWIKDNFLQSKVRLVLVQMKSKLKLIQSYGYFYFKVSYKPWLVLSTTGFGDTFGLLFMKGVGGMIGGQGIGGALGI